jgi:hypothetical protein
VLIAIDDVNQFSAEKSLAFLEPDHQGLRPPYLDSDKMMMVRHFNDIVNHGLVLFLAFHLLSETMVTDLAAVDSRCCSWRYECDASEDQAIL